VGSNAKNTTQEMGPHDKISTDILSSEKPLIINRVLMERSHSKKKEQPPTRQDQIVN